MSYGVQPTGYVRKPISIILSELEAAMITEFGPGVIQTAASPLGQLNGLMADLLAEIDERNLELYQSYDPDQAEGRRLQALGRLRLAFQGNRTEQDFRRAITNTGQARIDIQDVEHAIRGLPGVELAKLWTEADAFGPGTVAVAVIGGDESDIADAIRQYIVPGIATFGNYRVSSVINGSCRSFSIIRPIEVPVTLSLVVRSGPQAGGCPSPSTVAIREAVVTGWTSSRENNLDLNSFMVRKLVEGSFPNVEVIRFTATRGNQPPIPNAPVEINFLEIGFLTNQSVTVTYG